MNQVRVGIGVIVVRTTDDGEVEILLGKRKSEWGKGKWSFPGGHLEFGETWRDCAVRELKEETGLDFWCKQIDFVGANETICLEQNRHYTTIYMAVAAESEDEAQTMEPDKFEGWDWFIVPTGLPKDIWEPARECLTNFWPSIERLVPPF